jgi:drug/metabolite transporter (DMT)-like permease
MSSNTEEIQLSYSHASETGSHQSVLSQELRPVTRRRQILILISSFLTICITIGFNQSYGVFQSYYTSADQDLLPKDAKDQTALIAFVGTLGAGLTWAGSIAVNPLMARVGDLKYLTASGVVCISAAFGLASLSSQVSVSCSHFLFISLEIEYVFLLYLSPFRRIKTNLFCPYTYAS